MTTLTKLLTNLPSDHRIKLGADGGSAWFYVGTVGDLITNMSKFSDAITLLTRYHKRNSPPLPDRAVVDYAICDPWVEPQECIRILVEGTEVGLFWDTAEAGDRIPQFGLRTV